jgi:hypothetical protein
MLNSAAPWPDLVQPRPGYSIINASCIMGERRAGPPVDDVFNVVCDRATLRVAWSGWPTIVALAPLAWTAPPVTWYSAAGLSRSWRACGPR